MLAIMDEGVGEILDTLDRLDLSRDTLVNLLLRQWRRSRDHGKQRGAARLQAQCLRGRDSSAFPYALASENCTRHGL